MADPDVPDVPADKPPAHEPLRITVGGKQPDLTPGPQSGSGSALGGAAGGAGPDDTKPYFGSHLSGKRHDTEAPIPRVTSQEEYDGVPYGKTYTDAEGNTYKKNYVVGSAEEYANVPEGEAYRDPQGNEYKKTKYEGIGFTAQTLYDMALTDDGRRQALKTVYGDKIKTDPMGELYVDDDGVARKPGRGGVTDRLGHAAAETAPALGMAGGGQLGGAAGSLIEPGGGTVLGYVSGMAGGAMLGRAFNNAVLGLAGIHEDMEPQVLSIVREGAGATGGEILGKTVSKVPGVMRAVGDLSKVAGGKIAGVKEAVKGNLPGVLESFGMGPERARSWLGISQERAGQAADITNRGGKVPPSAAFPEAPGLKKIEEFDAVFRAQNVFAEANRAFYEQEAKIIMEDAQIGIKPTEPATRATKKVSSEAAGQMALDAARRDMAFADAALEQASRVAKESALRPLQEMGGTADVQVAYATAMKKLTDAHQAAKTAAENYVKEAIADLRRSVDTAIAATQEGDNPGAAWRVAAAKFEAYKAATKLRANQMYDAFRKVAVGVEPDVSGLAADAQGFLDRLPEQVKQKYPGDIRLLAKLAGEEQSTAMSSEAMTLEAPEPPTPPSLADLHLMRSWLRHGIDYTDLTPDMREGSMRLFEKKINRIIHDGREGIPAEHKDAAVLLDQADAFYKQAIPVLNDEMVKSVMKGLESGSGNDPQALAKLFFNPERTEALRKVRGIVGEPLWNTVQAADVRTMLDNSKTLDPSKFDGRAFAGQVLDRVRNGIIKSAYDREMADKVMRLGLLSTQDIDGALPVAIEPGDTMHSLMRKIAAAAEQMKQFADRDPIKALSGEMSRIDKTLNQAMQQAKAGRRADPLGFLYEDSMSAMAVRAADKILGSQDLVMAASQKFGRESPEFKALQQVYVQRFFQRSFGKTGTMRAELADDKKGMTEEMQALMFPGVTRDAMQTLVKDMEFLFSGSTQDFGGSMAAASRVLNPWSQIPIPKLGGVSAALLHLPGAAFVGRKVLGDWFAAIMDGVSHPNFMNWLANNVKAGGPQRDMARQVLQQRLGLGELAGAGLGQYETGAPDPQRTLH